MDYRIITTPPGSSAETIVHAPPLAPWTHDSATAWAHQEGRHLPDGSRIAIDRRRGSAPYQPHRRYEVNEGIARRTDR